MSRDASGNYTLPAGNPVVSGTAISSTTHNNTMSDLATEMQDSLSRSGKGGMTAPLRTADGTAGAPSYSFTNDNDLGFYRISNNAIGVSLGNALRVEFNNGLRIYDSGGTDYLSFSHDGTHGTLAGTNTTNLTITGITAITLGGSTMLTAANLAANLLTPLLTVDGAGSGIDADLLDGVNGAGYALASHTHSAGDITSGTLVVGRGGTGQTSELGYTRRVTLNWTIQSDPGGTPSGTAGDVFAYY